MIYIGITDIISKEQLHLEVHKEYFSVMIGSKKVNVSNDQFKEVVNIINQNIHLLNPEEEPEEKTHEEDIKEEIKQKITTKTPPKLKVVKTSKKNGNKN